MVLVEDLESEWEWGLESGSEPVLAEESGSEVGLAVVAAVV